MRSCYFHDRRTIFTTRSNNNFRLGLGLNSNSATNRSMFSVVSLAPQLVYQGKIDFLVFDYLAEITMSILAAAKRKSPDMGYATDFVQVTMGPLLNEIKRQGIRVVSNSGGVNPQACCEALQQVAKKAGVDLKIAVVTGDDLMRQMKDIAEQGITDIDSGRSFPRAVASMNAYLGATPISKALDMGADIVVTGRCVDSAVVLGPLMNKFKWGTDDYDRLAMGSLAGHLVECGAQATGGTFTDWHLVEGWDKIGFPIVECSSDGTFILSKPPKTGGLVTTATVAEQLIYEIGDPRRYLLPDVTCDFSNVSLSAAKDPTTQEDGVSVAGAKGLPPSSKYKVTATYLAGNKIVFMCVIGGPRAAEKGQKTAENILKRVRGMLKFLGMEDFSRTHVQMLGRSPCTDRTHAIIRLGSGSLISAEHPDKKGVGLLARELAPAGTGMAPGTTGPGGGRPKMWKFTWMESQRRFLCLRQTERWIPQSQPRTSQDSLETAHTFTVGQLAYTRSGDKANSANVGVIARHPSYLPYLKQALTEETVEAYFEHVLDKSSPSEKLVTRYELPGITALNFVLQKSLGGGGVASMRADPQGKCYGQMLLDFEIPNLPDLLSKTNSKSR
ncbi:hypothetical protein BSL78_21838 [Apostichopus japonicus]|uniref:Terpene utilization protein AtuA n=1 Tax=Stichopus japonicus TaxID=307972 RepID=A0A2G8JZY4_STIJA|nr:hypothetical protein BSL78_21838 [Apostichopus japonicus]